MRKISANLGSEEEGTRFRNLIGFPDLGPN